MTRWFLARLGEAVVARAQSEGQARQRAMEVLWAAFALAPVGGAGGLHIPFPLVIVPVARAEYDAAHDEADWVAAAIEALSLADVVP